MIRRHNFERRSEKWLLGLVEILSMVPVDTIIWI